MTKRFELKSIHFHKLYIIVYDNLKEEELHLSIFELVELLNKVSQKEYDLKKIGDEIKRKLDEILEKEVGEWLRVFVIIVGIEKSNISKEQKLVIVAKGMEILDVFQSAWNV